MIEFLSSCCALFMVIDGELALLQISWYYLTISSVPPKYCSGLRGRSSPYGEK